MQNAEGSELVSIDEEGEVAEVEDIEESIEETVIWEFLHDEPQLCVASSPVADEFASGSVDEKLRIWKGETLISEVSEFDESVCSVKYNLDGTMIAASSLENSLVVVTNEGNVLCCIDGPSRGIESLEFHPTHPDVLLAGDGEGLIWIVNARNGTIMSVLSGHSNAITSASFTRDGRNVVSGGTDGTLKIWAPNSEPQCVFTAPEDGKNSELGAIFSISCANVVHGETIPLASSCYEDGRVALWTTPKKLIRNLPGHSSSAEVVRFSPTNEFLCSTGMDGIIHVNHVSTSTSMALNNGGIGITCLEWVSDHSCITGDAGGFVKQWDVRQQEEGKILVKHGDSVLGLAVSFCGERGFSVAEDSRLKKFALLK